MPPKRRRVTSSGTPLPTTSTTSTTFSASIDTRTTPSSTPTAHRTTVTSPGSVPSTSSVFIGAMKVARDSDNKLNHTSGQISFVDRADEHVATGHPTPFVATFCDRHVKNHEDLVVRVRADYLRRHEEAVASAPTPPRVEGSDETAAPPPVVLDLDTQVDILLTNVGLSKGTHVLGFGTQRAALKKRGPKSGGSNQSSGPMFDEVVGLKEDNARLTMELQELRTETMDIRQRIAALEALVEKIMNAPPHTCSQPPRPHHREDPPPPSATS